MYTIGPLIGERPLFQDSKCSRKTLGGVGEQHPRKANLRCSQKGPFDLLRAW